jgi:hypothetical protein
MMTLAGDQKAYSAPQSKRKPAMRKQDNRKQTKRCEPEENQFPGPLNQRDTNLN